MSSQTSHHDVLVIGSGLTGALIAAQLAQRGARVAVVDAVGAIGSATRRALGLAVPHPHPAHWAETARGVKQLVQICEAHRVPVRLCSVGYLATHEAGRARLQRLALAEASAPATWNEALPIHQNAVAEGLLAEVGALVDLERLCAVLLHQRNITLRYPLEVMRLERESRAVYALSQGYTLSADWIVLATNAFTGLLSPYLGESVRLLTSVTWRSYPLPDEAVRLEHPIVVNEGEFAVLPLDDGSVHAIACSADPLAPHANLTALLRELDESLLMHTAEQCSGVLTAGAEGAPLVGRLDSQARVLYAIGLGPFGAAWAPLVCERVLALMQTP
ncbi:MAG: FAD-binding oxidoreductase [Thermoflexales bacterium]|nr:FAD-binding oxidoreductase [Thermoflexales bacterium]MCX7938347.1 FAD-binding oxidoreductase [Thermoflexales bacterium]